MTLRTHFQTDFSLIDDDEGEKVNESRQLSVMPRVGENVHFGGDAAYVVVSVMWDYSRHEYPIVQVMLDVIR